MSRSLWWQALRAAAIGLCVLVGTGLVLVAFTVGSCEAFGGRCPSTPPPILEVGCLAEMFAGGAVKSQGLAAAIKAMTERLGVGFFDAGAVIQVSPVDGIHYEAAAQIALGQALAAAVRRHFGT